MRFLSILLEYCLKLLFLAYFRVKLCNQQVGLLKNYLSDYVQMSKWLDRMERKAPYRGQKPLEEERTDALYVSQLARKWDDAKVSIAVEVDLTKAIGFLIMDEFSKTFRCLALSSRRKILHDVSTGQLNRN